MDDGTTAISFAYNADGQRVSKTVGNVTYNYVYAGSTLTDVTWGSNAMHFIYDALGASAVVYNGTTYYYLRNAQGDIVGIVDTSGNTVVSYAYDAWGRLLSTTGSLASTLGTGNPLRYRGYFYDTETGLYYLMSRYYNPTWGRFINADTTAVLTTSPNSANWDKNLFAYCDNNPVSRKDDGGQFWNTIIGAVVGGIWAIATRDRNESWQQALLRGATTGAIAGAALDICIATGGVAGVAICVGLSAASGAIDSVWEDKNNERDIDPVKALVNAGVSGAMGALFGAAGRVAGRATGATAKTVVQATWKNTTSQVLNRSNHFLISKAVRNLAVSVAETVTQSIFTPTFRAVFYK